MAGNGFGHARARLKLGVEHKTARLMKLKKLHLERFRQFQNAAVECGEFNLLVGPNNCGKTSILHAIRAFFLLMSGHVWFEGDPPKAKYHRRFLSSADEIAPTPDLQELWFNRQAGSQLKISVTFEDDVTFAVVLRQQFGQIHVSAEDLPDELTSARVKKYLDTPVAFIPGLVGVLVNEPYATAARRNALAAQGRYSEIFRSSLQQLNNKSPELVQSINEWLKGLFDVRVSEIAFDENSDEFVTVKYHQRDKEYDVVSSGAGLQQVIQMLTYLYLSKPRVLLVDEPDAHLHSRLQARMGEVFRRVASDLEAQVFLSTHSLDLIDTFATTEVIVVDASKKVMAPIGQQADLVSTLVDAGIVDVSALSRLLASRRLVVVEDKDQTILKAIDKAAGALLYSVSTDSYVLPAHGVGNFRAIADLGKVLSALIGQPFDLTFLQDRDGLPDFLVTAYEESQKGNGVHTCLLSRHEIESYLVEPSLLVKVSKLAGKKITEAVARKAIQKAGNTLRQAARRKCRETAKQINRHLDQDARYEEPKLEEKADAWFDSLDFTEVEVIQRVIPGKELLRETLKVLNGDKKMNVTKGKLVAAIDSEVLDTEIVELLQTIANGTIT